MSNNKQLQQYTIAISISESPDMAVRGLGEEHLDDAMAEIARHLLAKGAQLIYGGDLRPGGFTEILFELVTRHHQDDSATNAQALVANYFAWPVHVDMTAEEVAQLSDDLSGAANLICLAVDGKVIEHEARQQHVARPAAEQEWATGLSAMRKTMADSSDARIVLGGKVEQFKGIMPGIAEEALIALKAKQPLFLIGGFGGCAYDIAVELGLLKASSKGKRVWPGRDEFTPFNLNNLNNGLSDVENITLAKTVHIDQAVALILRGLVRLQGV